MGVYRRWRLLLLLCRSLPYPSAAHIPYVAGRSRSTRRCLERLPNTQRRGDKPRGNTRLLPHAALHVHRIHRATYAYCYTQW